MFRTDHELRELLCIGKEIFKEKHEISQMSVSSAIDYLNDGTKEMIHNRWGAVARMFVDKITDYSFANILLAISNEDIPEYLGEIIIFLLQDEYGFEVVPFMIFAQKKGTLKSILSYCLPNIINEHSLRSSDLTELVDLIECIPQERRDIAFGDIAKLIIKTKNDGFVFKCVLANCSDSKMLFLSILIEESFRYDQHKGEEYLVYLLGLPNVGELIVPIANGLHISLRHNVMIFEEYHSIFSSLEGESAIWVRLIPCYIEYVIINSERNDTWSKVLESLRALEFALPSEKSAYYNATNYRNDLTEELVYIKDAILKHSFNKDNQMLNSVASFFYRKMRELSVDALLDQLQQVFILNEYGLSDYKKYFDAFNGIWPSIMSHTNEVWCCFMKMVFDKQENSFVFALGLFEHAVNINGITKNSLSYSINASEACLLLKLLTAFVINPERLCRFAFQILNIIKEDDDWNIYIDTYMDNTYRSYPGTSKEVSELFVEEGTDVQRNLAVTINSQFESERLLQQKWKEIPDLWPSDEHRRIYNSAWHERNHSISKQVMQQSIFGNIFPRALLKYGKRVAFVQKNNPGKYRYAVQEFATCKSNFELPNLYTVTPLAWLRGRIDVLEERRAYVEAHTERLSTATEREG